MNMSKYKFSMLIFFGDWLLFMLLVPCILLLRVEK